jgi:hypothetical protein
VEGAEDEAEERWLALDHLRRHPLNLNEADADGLRQLPLLTPLHIDNLLRYRLLLGPLVHLAELQAVPGWDVHLIEQLLPFVTVSGNTEGGGRAFREGAHQWLFRARRIMEKSAGYASGRSNGYRGDPWAMLLRYRFQYKSAIHWGLTAEKDAGESFFAGRQRLGFDFYSAHYFLRKPGILSTLALGDFTVNMGQGLLLWQGGSFGQGASALAIKREAPVLQPYRSAAESGFCRGLAAGLARGRWALDLFLSYRRLTANRDEAQGVITSISSSGYHRTATEAEDKGRLGHWMAGAVASYRVEGLTARVNFLVSRFSDSLRPAPRPYNRFAFAGRQSRLASLDYSYTHRHLHFFGEAAVDGRGRVAQVHGLLLSAGPAADLALSIRNYPFRFQSLFGNAPGESGQPQNERGVYLGLVLRPAYRWEIQAYADFFQFPWLRYRTDRPSEGRELGLQVEHRPAKTAGLFLRYRYRQQLVNESGGGAGILLVQQQSVRLHWNWAPGPLWEVRGRGEWVGVRTGARGEEGFLAFLEAAMRKGKASLHLRLQYQGAESYASRVYVYETVLPSFTRFPAYDETGLRYYLQASAGLGKQAVVSLHWGQLLTGASELGSGLSAIRGGRRSECMLQLAWKLN